MFRTLDVHFLPRFRLIGGQRDSALRKPRQMAEPVPDEAHEGLWRNADVHAFFLFPFFRLQDIVHFLFRALWIKTAGHPCSTGE